MHSGKLLGCALLLLLVPTLLLAQSSTPEASAKKDSAKEQREDDPLARARWFIRGRMYNGKVGAEQRARAYQQKLNMARTARVNATRTGRTNAASGFADAFGFWTPIGPGPTATASGTDPDQDYGPVVGRVTTVAVDQNDPTGNTVYIGGASGGVWRSTNAADPAPTVPCSPTPSSGAKCAPNVSWQPLIDDQASLAVGAIALKPDDSNVILVGTGEANNSADSYYGVGFLRSADGGKTWTTISTANINGVSTNLHGEGVTQIAFSTANTNLVVATLAATADGLQVGGEFAGDKLRGIYYSIDAGQTWTQATVEDETGVTPVSGSNTAVVYNPQRNQFYAVYRYHGYYTSQDGQHWYRLGTDSNALTAGTTQPGGSLLDIGTCTSSPFNTSCPLYRGAIAVVPGRDEMYTFYVDVNDTLQGMFQTRDGGKTWTSMNTSGILTCGDGSSGSCGTTQGSYNMSFAAIPNGSGTDLYAGAVNEYKCTVSTPSNPASCSFANLTHVYGNCNTGVTGDFANVHPDEHGIDFSLNHPNIIYFGNDGGIYRTLNGFTNTAQICTSPGYVQLTSIEFDNLSLNMGAMLQFVSFSQDPNDPNLFLGGTQDNGSPEIDLTNPGTFWLSGGIADGGFNEINPVNGSDRFISLPSPLSIQRCTVSPGTSCDYWNDFPEVVNPSTIGGDSSAFYTPFILDPQGPNNLIVGSCRVWRGSRTGANFAALSNNFDVDIIGSASSTKCASTAGNLVSTVAAGGPTTANGSKVIWAGTEGTPTDNVTTPPTTGSGGRVFVTLNADGGPTTWKEVTMAGGINVNPTHYDIGDIAIDRADSSGQSVYLGILGFSGGTGGHVFHTTNAGSSWTDISGNLPDAPVSSIVVDPIATSTVYVGTDVGVFTTSNVSAVPVVWSEVGPATGAGSMPNVVVTKLRVFSHSGLVKLRASTYGRGIWESVLPSSTAGTFVVSISNASQSGFSGNAVTFNGSINTSNGYNLPITLACSAGSSPAPACVFNPPSPVTPGGSSTPISFTVNAAPGSYHFLLVATGSDGQTQSVPVALEVGDFTLSGASGPPITVTVPHATSTAAIPITLTPSGSLSSTVSLSCDSAAIPAGLSCAFTPASVPLSNSPLVSNLIITSTGSQPAANVYNFNILANTPGLPSPKTLGLQVTVTSNKTFSLTPGASTAVFAGKTAHIPVTVDTVDGYAGTVNLSCGANCTPAPASVSSFPTPVDVAIVTQATDGGNLSVTLTGTDSVNAAITHMVSLPYTVENYTLAGASSASLTPGNSTGLNFTLTSQGGYSGSVSVTCAFNPPVTGLSCSPTPASPYNVTSAVQFAGTVSAAAGTAGGGPFPLSITATDSNLAAHTATAQITVQTFSLGTIGNGASQTVAAGAAANYTIPVNAAGGLTGTVSFACSGLPQLSACNFSPNPLTLSASQNVTLTITTTAPVALLSVPPKPGRPASPLFAFWLGGPTVLGGVLLAGPRGKTGRRRSAQLTLLLMLAVFSLLLLQACGGGGGGTTTGPPPPKAGTPSGTYPITVTATGQTSAGTLIQTTNVTLVVQ